MAVNEVVSGVGADSKRTDNNVSERVAKVQREAKIQEASGGQYGQRANLASLASGQQTAQTASAVSVGPSQPGIQLPPTDIFAPSNQDVPLSHGAPGGPGAGTEVLQTPVDAIDQGSILIRAMYAANPTPQLRRMVEAYNEEGK